ncbi:hypothetical protein CR163_008385 [Prosthecochloris sp. ZM_2]|uniref:GumC family protein n=1 Tax=Prosthecochloris sp. ZM_2 TaxID=2045206 RepID=UPI000DF75C29|nr:Wzz/FepE/Etk N-terminal domain-containing protein [Prosthecochloris sp. ZM_2]RNA65238.1 hypothetical protein CR163_008385 [Prosthecochloris sp. ZM_2]
MTIIDFIRILLRHWLLIVLVPLSLAVMVFVLTMNEEKTYRSSTLLYTGLVSGASLENPGSNQVDYHAVSNAFDNMINTIESRQTLEIVAIRLLAEDIANMDSLPEKRRRTIRKTFTPEELEQLAVAGNAARTAENLEECLAEDECYALKKLLFTSYEPYSLRSLKKVSIRRQGNSDMVEMSYSTTDPELCQRTLGILTEVFTARMRQQKSGEAGTVLDYFRNEVALASQRLAAAEDTLKQFKDEHDIINYYEETEELAISQKDLEAEIRTEMKNLEQAKATVKSIDRSFRLKNDMYEISESILDNRNTLSEIETRLASGSVDTETAGALQQQADLLRKTIRKEINTLYHLKTSPEGIHQTVFVETWLENKLEIQRSAAKLEVLYQKQENLARRIEEFSTYGSTLERLNMRVKIAKSEYLELLHSLNVTQMHQKNIEMQADVDIIDPPNMPLEPQPSKRKLIVLLAFAGSMGACIVLLTAMDYLDPTLHSPERCKAITGLRLVGAFPKVDNKHKSINYSLLLDRTTEQLSSAIKLLHQQKTEAGRFVIVLFSHDKEEGKTFIAEKVSERIQATYYPARTVAPQPDIIEAIENPSGPTTLESALGTGPSDSHEILILEIPDLKHHLLPVRLLHNADAALLVARANRRWSGSDEELQQKVTTIIGQPPLMVLNAVEPDKLEGFLGEIPKKRSWLRIQVKKLFA